ncbi:MAG: dienelactone hydrolase, partial [Cyanobacteria bacterium P01_D01_bin.105]
QCNPAAEIDPELVNIGLLLQCRLLELESVPGVLTVLTSGELADERVGLVIAIAPITNLFGSQGMEHIEVPVVMLGGAYDVAAPVILEQVDAFASLTGTDKYFYLGEKISHNLELTRTLFSLLHPGEETEERVDQSLETSVSIVRTLSIAHGRNYLLGENSYLPYLTAAYVQAVSTEPAKIHLIRDLPF